MLLLQRKQRLPVRWLPFYRYRAAAGVGVAGFAACQFRLHPGLYTLQSHPPFQPHHRFHASWSHHASSQCWYMNKPEVATGPRVSAISEIFLQSRGCQEVEAFTPMRGAALGSGVWGARQPIVAHRAGRKSLSRRSVEGLEKAVTTPNLNSSHVHQTTAEALHRERRLCCWRHPLASGVSIICVIKWGEGARTTVSRPSKHLPGSPHAIYRASGPVEFDNYRPRLG